MEQTMEQWEERKFRRAVEKLASVVRAMAEERHLANAHIDMFERCDDPTCANAREAYMDL